MPLVSAFDAPTGDSYPDAYHVVVAVLLEPDHMTARVATYRDAAAAAAGRAPVLVRSVAWSGDEMAALAPAIEAALANLQEALLARPEFAGAVLVGDDGQPLPPPTGQPILAVAPAHPSPPPPDVTVLIGEPIDDPSPAPPDPEPAP